MRTLRLMGRALKNFWCCSFLEQTPKAKAEKRRGAKKRAKAMKRAGTTKRRGSIRRGAMKKR